MDREQFWSLVNNIKDNATFSPRQRSVVVQLLVALRRLGTRGNGSSIGMLARSFGVAEGSVDLYRCLVAILSLENQMLTWPDVAERRAIIARLGEQSRFQQCVGFADGSLIPFECKLQVNGEDFCTRSKL